MTTPRKRQWRKLSARARARISNKTTATETVSQKKVVETTPEPTLSIAEPKVAELTEEATATATTTKTPAKAKTRTASRTASRTKTSRTTSKTTS
jgi:hypothetical protein